MATESRAARPNGPVRQRICPRLSSALEWPWKEETQVYGCSFRRSASNRRLRCSMARRNLHAAREVEARIKALWEVAFA